MLVELLQRHRDAARSPEERRAVRAILSCRTARQGGHLYRCAPCAKLEFAYHSCHHRACPRVKGFASRGFAGLLSRRISLKVMFQLLLQESPATAAFQKLFAAFGVLFFCISFVVGQPPRPTKCRCEGQALSVFTHASP